MKFYKKMALIGASVLAVASLSACSNNNSSSKSSSKIPTKISKKTTINFWYSLTGTSQSTLKKLTNDFEKKNPNIHI